MKIAFVITWICCLLATAQAQEQGPSSFIGLDAHYEFGSPTAFNREVNVINVFTTQGKGVSWDNAIGIGLLYKHPAVFSSDLGLSFVGRFTVGAGQFKSNQFLDSANNTFAPVDFKLYSYYKTIEASTQLTYALIDNCYLGTGFWVNARVSSTVSQHEQLVYPDTAIFFGNGTNDKVIAEGDSISTTRIHYGIPVSFGGIFRLSRTLLFNAELFSKFDLEEALRGFTSVSFSGGASLGLLFDLHPAPAVKDSTQTSDIQTPAILSASVLFNVNGISTERVASHSIDTLKRRYLSLPQSFDALNAELSIHALSEQERDKFSLTQFDNADPDHCYRELWNIIGKRLSGQPAERIELRIVKKNQAAAEASKRIRDYLVQTWSAVESQVEIVTVETQTSDVQVGGSAKILSPLINEWKESHAVTPEITIDKTISSNLGVRSWRIDLYDGSRLLKTYSDRDAASDLSFSNQTIDNTTHTLSAILTASDLNGNIRIATDTIVIHPPETNTHTASATQEQYIVSAFSVTGGWDSLLIDRIVRSATEQSVITITAYTVGNAIVSAVSNELLGRLEKAGKKIKKIVIDQRPYSLSAMKSTRSLCRILVQ